MIQCRALNYAVLTSPDPVKQVAYYRDVMGLVVSSQSERHVALATPQGLESIVLLRGKERGLTALGFRVSPRASLEQVKHALVSAGIPAEIRSGYAPTAGRVVAFRDANGTEIELSNALAFADVTFDGRGVAPLKLGHVACFVSNVTSVSDFYMTQLGFRKSDWRSSRHMFLRCSTDHHTINFFEGEPRLAHLAFEVKDFSALVRAADYLTQKGYPLDWGPARHTIGHNCACYHTNDDGIRIELYAEMDQMSDEDLGYFDPKPWHEDRPQRPKDWEELASPRNKWIPGVP